MDDYIEELLLQREAYEAYKIALMDQYQYAENDAEEM